VDLGDARLADLLNRNQRVLVRDAVVVRISDGHTQEFKQLEIDRNELDAVVASGARGDPRLRQPTACECVAMKLGTYSAEGFMHETSGRSENISRGAPAMVALTDAVIEYNFCEQPVSQWFRTLLVNRKMATSLRTVADANGQVSGIAKRPEARALPSRQTTVAARP
jgi:hypothetical protein